MTTINSDQVSRRRVYDSRLREFICAAGNADLFPELNIPQSTIRGWLRSEFRTAVGAESVSRTEIELYAEIAKLRGLFRKGRGRTEQARDSSTRGTRSSPDREPRDDLRNVQGEHVDNRPLRSRLNRKAKAESTGKSSETNYRAEKSRRS